MSTAATVRVMSQEEIAALGSSQVPHLRLPIRASYFAERAMRLRQLARQHAMGDFLEFMAHVAQAQQQALAALPADTPLPSADDLASAARHGQPPLDIEKWPRHPAWHQALRHIAAAVLPHAPATAQASLQALLNADDATLERQADAVLGLPATGVQLAHAPIIGAALQTYWVHLVTAVQARQPDKRADSLFGRTDHANVCPCCGSLPVASITRNEGGALAQRFVHCSLCGTEWHLQRTQCPHCLERDQLAFQSLDRTDLGDDAPANSQAAKASVQAEECGACGHYLKIMHTDRNPMLDPVADDLASLTLDLLMAESGKHRHGHNMALIFHDDGAAPAAPTPRH